MKNFMEMSMDMKEMTTMATMITMRNKHKTLNNLGLNTHRRGMKRTSTPTMAMKTLIMKRIRPR